MNPKEAAESDGKPQKYFADQLDDEEVLFVFRKHPVVMRKGLVFGLLGPLVGVIPAAVRPELGFGWFFAGLLGAWFYSVFIVTDQRLIQITQRGLFRRSVVDLGLNKIQSLNYEVSGLQPTLLGYGTILVQTYMGDLVIHDVHHPANIYKQLITILKDHGVSPDVMSPESE